MQATTNLDPLTTAVYALVDAFAVHDEDTIDRAFRDLSRAVRSLDGMVVNLGVRGADLDDLRQELLARLHQQLRACPEIASPRAWVRTIARNLALDFLRRRTRQATTPMAPEILVERSGVYLFEDLYAVEREERERDGHRAQLAGWVEAYVDEADALRTPRGHHVRAWYARRVEGRSITAIASDLSTEGQKPSADLVSKWVDRGAELVRGLAERDREHERAAAMRRACGS
jgi:DNA-directed RNA polymerase specialized sigma24 family protein